MALNPFRKQRELEFEALDRWRVARRLASDDVTDLGGQLAELHADDLGHEAPYHYRQALELHAQAKEKVRTSATVEDILEVEQLLVDARYHRAGALALRAGEPLPSRREPCFFDPRHGPSMSDVQWTPPAGVARTVSACAADGERIEGGEAPPTRSVRVGDRYVPVHEVGGYQGILDDHNRLFYEQLMSHDNNKHLAQVDLWAPGTRFGGGGGGDGGSSTQSSAGH